METDFDRLIDRRAYPTQRWNPADLRQYFGTDDLLPFWIADMDFEAPQAVIDGLVRRARHGVYGYEYRPDSFYEALIGWYDRRHGWPIDRSHICNSPGILNAIAVVINMYTEESDGVIIQPPVFFEFRTIIRNNSRAVVRNPLILEGGRYRIDCDDLEALAADSNNKLLILCNPHNPTGRVWRREELIRVGEICRQHGVRIIADEIHGDIVFEGHHYTPFASLPHELARNSFTCLSAAKTFNLPGVVDGFVVIPDDEHREAYLEIARRYQLNRTNVFASAAMEAAYRQGDRWLGSLLAYLQGNLEIMREYLAANTPKIRMIDPEGTYLAWLDFRALGLEVKELERFLALDAKLALNAGYWFGRQGAGFARMTIASPRSLLQNALKGLKDAVDGKLLGR